MNQSQGSCAPSWAPVGRTSRSCSLSCESSTQPSPSRWRSRPTARAFGCSTRWPPSSGTPLARRPIVLVLDDLHAADSPSLLLLEFLAGELDGSRLMILGAYRDTETGVGHPLSATLAEVARARLPPGGSSWAVSIRSGRWALHRARNSARRHPRASVAALHRGHTRQPLCLLQPEREASLLSDERLLDEGAMERLPIPPGVHDAIGNRLPTSVPRLPVPAGAGVWAREA